MNFKCVNCNKEKDDSELGSINHFLRIGFAILIAPIGSSSVCQKCVTQVSFVGFIGAIFIIIAVIGTMIKVFF